MTTGEKICKLRESACMSQDEMAEKLDVSRQTVSNWENDKNKIDLEKVKLICSIFKISLDELCSDEEIKTVKTSENTGRGNKPVIIFSSVMLIVSFAVLITALVFAFTSEKNGQISSAVTLSGVFGWISVAVISLAVAAVALFIIFKSRGK